MTSFPLFASRWLSKASSRTTVTKPSCLHLAAAALRHSSSDNAAAANSSDVETVGIGNVNVDGLISGVTTEMVQKDPVLIDYIRANYPELFETEEDRLAKGITNWGERRRTAPKPHLNIRPLSTVKRCPETEEGTRRCVELREGRYGMIPGIIYGSDPTLGIRGHPRPIFVKTPARTVQSHLDRHGHAFESRVFNLSLYDTLEDLQDEATTTTDTYRVLPRDVNVHPVTGVAYCCNFLRYFPGRPIKIPLTLINEEESPALKREGYLIPINKFVECIIEDGVDIPDELEVECTGLQFKEVIRLDRIDFPEGVKPSKKVLKHPDWMVGPIHGGKGGPDDEDGEQGAGGDEESDED